MKKVFFRPFNQRVVGSYPTGLTNKINDLCRITRVAPRKTDFALYRERNLVEPVFCRLKQFRAIATRYDKLANTFIAAVAMVCLIFWLN